MDGIKLNHNLTDVSQWDTRALASYEKHDAWEEILTEHYRNWEIHKPLDRNFSAELKAIDLNGMKIVHCCCSPCSGQRTNTQISTDTDLFLGVQINRKGKEVFVIDEKQYEVGAGDLVLWLTDQPTEFHVLEDLDKVSIILPYDEFSDYLPLNSNIRGNIINANKGVGSILFNHIDNLEKNINYLDESDYTYLRKTTIELLAMTVSKQGENLDSYLYSSHLKKIKKYIVDHIVNPELSPQIIADAHSISIRYLHMLFAKENLTVSNFIKDYRLRLCAEDLVKSSKKAFISSIAYKWGFNNSAHFSHAFKSKFLCSPSQYREKQRYG